MLKLLSQREIKENWDVYKTYLKTAATSSDGALVVSDSGSESFLKNIYGRLMNPFTTVMHLWSEGKNKDYIVLTQLQVCEFTSKRTLILFSATRTTDVDKETLSERYFEAYKSISKFAKENKCVGMICYSDLDYFAELAKETKEWTNVITRYQFYFPLN